jgi:hypothetical protein
VFFDPLEVKPALEHIMFDEWKLPQKAQVVSGGTSG